MVRTNSAAPLAGPAASSREPYYREIARVLRNKILSGEYAFEDRLPSETVLASQFGVSRMTARQAVSQLVNEGRVYRVQGRGAFVAHTTISRNPNSLVGFYADMERLGLRPGSTVLRSELRLPTDREQRSLDIGKSDRVHYVERVRSVDDEPVGVQHFTVPEWILPDFDPDTLLSTSFYARLEKQGTPIVHAHQRVEAVHAPDMAELIGAQPTTAFLKIDRVSRIEREDRPVEMLTSWFRGDRFSYEGDLRRQDGP